MFKQEDMKIMEFTKSQSPYTIGEVAGFPELKAKRLYEAQVAKYRPDLQREFDKKYAQDKKDAEEREESNEVVKKPRRTVRVSE